MDMYCYSCEGEIKTTDGSNGFFWLIDGKWTIINQYGDKEPVCNICLKKDE